jgi:hypothetical protein
MGAASAMCVASYIVDDERFCNAVLTRLQGRRPFTCQVVVDDATFRAGTSRHQRARLRQLQLKKGASVGLAKGFSGVPVFGPRGCEGSMHMKAVVFDGRVAFVGSSNITKASQPVQLGALLQDSRGTGATDFGGRAEGYTSFSDVAVAIGPCLGVLHASAPRKPLSAADPRLLSANAGSNQRRRVPGTNRRALRVASLACLPCIAVEPTCCKTCAACIAAPASERLAACIAACIAACTCSLCRPARPRGHWGGIGRGGGGGDGQRNGVG